MSPAAFDSLHTHSPADAVTSAPQLATAASLASRDSGVARPALSIGKRAFDQVFATIACVLAAPLFLAVALFVRLSSPGPIVFRQRRLGLMGEPFTVLKFRTMRHGASEDRHREYVAGLVGVPSAAAGDRDVFKLTGDDRVTPGGLWLRRTSLDELPQFWNVLRGEMSVVGPRPPLEYEVERYEAWQWDRLRVRPGLTGLWQVSGRNRHTYFDMVKLDLVYIREWSFLGDLRIIARTPWVMLSNSGKAA